MQTECRQIIQDSVYDHTPIFILTLHDDMSDHIVAILIHCKVFDVLEDLIEEELKLGTLAPFQESLDHSAAFHIAAQISDSSLTLA